MTLRVTGGAAGVGAWCEELDALARALLEAAGDCAVLTGAVLTGAVLTGPVLVGGPQPALIEALFTDPGALVALMAELAAATAALCRAATQLATLGSAVAAAAAAYRGQESAVQALMTGVPLVIGARLRVGLAMALATGAGLPLLVTGAAAAGAANLLGPGEATGWRDHQGWDQLAHEIVIRPGVVDIAVRLLPGLLGTAGVPATARVLLGVGWITGLVQETAVHVRTVEPLGGCRATSAGPKVAAPATGVADLLRRNQSVAAWREPGEGRYDTLPPGAPRPQKGQVRVDRVTGADDEVAWVVHIPGTQEWDTDGEGSPMDLAANAALVAGTDTAVATGIAAAMVQAGVQRGQPVAVVGHSQGGMTAMDLAADPTVRGVATISHVVTAGSPLAGRTPPPGVQVIALEHTDDLVPRLDGRTARDRPERVTVTSSAPDGPWRTDAVPAHSSSAYVATAERVDASTHPSLVAYREGLAPFLAREGASCESQQFVLTRART